MRILVNIPRPDRPGGVANYFRVLRDYLGADVDYFEAGSETGETGFFSSIRRLMSDYRRFAQTLRCGEHSVVHLNPSLGPKAAVRDALFLLIARSRSVSVLVFFHGWNADVLASIQRWYGPLFRLVMNKANSIVVLAEEFRTQILDLGVTTSVRVLTTCVDDSVFIDSEANDRDHRNINILYLSRLDHGKGVIESIHAFDAIRKDFPDAILNIAGDGPERVAAEKLVKDSQIENVNFLGYIEGAQKHDAFGMATIYFFPTFYGEGMPVAVLEAMAYGLPVVTRAVGGLKDFFENGQMGLITDSRSIEDLSSMLRKLVQDPAKCQQMGSFNREFARSNFAASAVAGKLRQLYSEIAD